MVRLAQNLFFVEARHNNGHQRAVRRWLRPRQRIVRPRCDLLSHAHSPGNATAECSGSPLGLLFGRNSPDPVLPVVLRSEGVRRTNNTLVLSEYTLFHSGTKASNTDAGSFLATRQD